MLLDSDDPSKRIKGLILIKKNIANHQSVKIMNPDLAHEILNEVSMLMRNVLNEINPDVYLEALKLLRFAFNQLLKYL